MEESFLEGSFLEGSILGEVFGEGVSVERLLNSLLISYPNRYLKSYLNGFGAPVAAPILNSAGVGLC